MDKKTPLDKLPSRIKYYLLDWKDKNMLEYLNKYGSLRLHDLTADQLHGLFSYASTKSSFVKVENFILFASFCLQSNLTTFNPITSPSIS